MTPREIIAAALAKLYLEAGMELTKSVANKPATVPTDAKAKEQEQEEADYRVFLLNRMKLFSDAAGIAELDHVQNWAAMGMEIIDSNLKHLRDEPPYPGDQA